MNERFKVVIPDFINDELGPETEILGNIADLVACDAYHEDELVGRIEDANAIMLYHNLSITRKTIEKLQDCKLIVRCGVGFDNVDRLYARERGIPVANIPDYGSEEVADSAIGMALTLTRGVHTLNSMLQTDPQKPWMYTHVVPQTRLRGQVFGIVGLGRIGTAAAVRAKALGMDVVFYDPYKEDGYDKAVGVRRVESLRELFEQSYILSLHCPLNDESRHIVNSKTIDWLPMGSYLVNTARGAVVDTDIIPDAIASGRLAGAGIDVLEEEPPSPENPIIAAWRDPTHPAYHRVIVNPHSAFYAEEGLMDMRVKGANAIRRALTGQPLRNIVN